jgi:type II secretory pathway component GspD/PulD (secretin)
VKLFAILAIAMLALPNVGRASARPESGRAEARPTSDAQEPTVTIDVKDAELRPVLKDMQRQCGIRNLILDPDVQGSGATFLFHEVPCTQAFDAVFKTYGLKAVQYENSVVHVSRRK